MGMSGGGGSGGGGGRRGSRRGGHGRGGPISEINVTPLVDVMLVLLIIFMVAAPMLTVGVPIDLPATKAAELNNQATEEFGAGVESRDRAEHYVRITVLLAAVLFLIALGQRFTIRNVRRGMLSVAGVFLVYSVILLLTYPRA